MKPPANPPDSSRVFLFGAGASAAYVNPQGIAMPLVTNFFDAGYKAGFLEEDMCHPMLNYTAKRSRCSVPNLGRKVINLEELMTELSDAMELRAAKQFSRSTRINLKELMTELSAAMGLRAAKKAGRSARRKKTRADLLVDRQLVLFIKWTLLKIAAGGRSPEYSRFVAKLKPGDNVISFNYDLLLDRAMAESGAWFFNDGYGVRFDAAYQQGQWRYPLPPTQSEWRLFKVHGSLNWLYPQSPMEHFRVAPETPLPPNLFLHLGIEADIPESGWYEHTGSLEPPEEIIDHVDLFSLIVPPLRKKSYEFFAHALGPVWKDAGHALQECRELVSIGYSLPASDDKAIELLRQAVTSGKLDRIVIVNRDVSRVDHYKELLQFQNVEQGGRDFSKWVSKWEG